MKEIIEKSLKESIEARNGLLEIIPLIEKAARIIWDSLSRGGKIILLGNGGSAADAQHIAAEMVGRFEHEHAPIPAVALTTNSSILTALSNDFCYDDIFVRQMMALLLPEDVVVAISTSGKSKNVIASVEFARSWGARVVSLTGKSGGDLKNISDVCLAMPSERTARVQECHILVGHILCELIEKLWIEEGDGAGTQKGHGKAKL
jgi:D-sedoheptulose 7-phosphate isomerase